MDNLTVSPSPHIRSGATTSKIMLHVLIALFPALVISAYLFGGRALVLTSVCMLSAVIWEKLCNIVMKRPDTTHDLSAFVTGMLLAFNLPPTLPYWMAVIGTFVAIVIVKQIFGGLGQNFANPAIVGRIVLMLSFTGPMTNWIMPSVMADVSTAPTPLVDNYRLYSYWDLFIGRCPGCLGEVSAAALIAGGIYLVAVRVITPHAPLAFISTAFAFSWAAGKDPLYQILSGGLMLGAIFMATDYVTTPVSKTGKVIFGIGCGIITCVIRFYANYPEGVSFSILIMNIATPYIDMVTRRKPVGAAAVKKEAQAGEK